MERGKVLQGRLNGPLSEPYGPHPTGSVVYAATGRLSIQGASCANGEPGFGLLGTVVSDVPKWPGRIISRYRIDRA